MVDEASYIERRLNVAGKIAVIVGGGGGLGRAVALEFARAQMSVALCDINDVLLAETSALCREAGARVVAMTGDARDPDVLDELFHRCDNELGALHTLVNVVGGTYKQPFADSAPKGWDALIRTNFTWLLHATHLAIPRMRPAGGSVINITSIEAHRAAPNFAVYAAMKAAVTSLTRTLAVELAADGIRINTIAPDRVPTERTYSQSDEQRAPNGWGDDPGGDLATQIGIPMGRRGTYDDVGGTALFLASDLSTYTTGTSQHPDGGVAASAGWFNWPESGYLNFPPPSITGALLAHPQDDHATR